MLGTLLNLKRHRRCIQLSIAAIFSAAAIFYLVSFHMLLMDSSKTPKTNSAALNVWLDSLHNMGSATAPAPRHIIMSTSNSLCSVPFAYGEMCPKSYTELGGVCEMNSDGTFRCPDIRLSATTTLRQTQLVITRMLRLFDLVARKHGIRYWLHSGTLIGAARHNGSLPWEHDGDIEMPLEDYIKFFKYASKELPDDIFFQNTKSDPNLPCDSGAPHDEVGCYKRPRNPRLRDKKSCYKYCRAYGCKWHDGLQVDIFVMNSSTAAEFPLYEMTFEGFRFPVSNNWLKKLEDEFGRGIMKLPVVSERKPKASPNTLHSCEELAKSKP